jgi:hypothetical protein
MTTDQEMLQEDAEADKVTQVLSDVASEFGEDLVYLFTDREEEADYQPEVLAQTGYSDWL